MTNANVGLLAKLKAKPGKESDVEALLKSALEMARAESQTNTWFAIRIDQSTFGIFDTFADESGRTAHLEGDIAAALMAKAPELLAEAPDIKKVDILAAKLPA